MIAQILSVIVPQPHVDAYLDHTRTRIIPTYESAAGLIAVSLLQRPVVAYVELLTFTIWESPQALSQFVEAHSPTDAIENHHGIIQLEPHTYQLVISRFGTSRSGEDSQQG